MGCAGTGREREVEVQTFRPSGLLEGGILDIAGSGYVHILGEGFATSGRNNCHTSLVVNI